MLIKGLKALWGLLIIFFCVRIFDPNKIFKGKRIAIVGPADSALQKENASLIDSFDYVIRINKSLVNKKDSQIPFIGSKSNILFHNFYENIDKGGGGPLDLDLFNKQGVQYLVQPRNNSEGWRVMYNFYKKYLNAKRVYIFPRKSYKELNKIFSPLKPTMGFCALYAALTSPSKEVFITGFTFFKTPYAQGYRDHLLDLKANELHIKEQGQHSPDLEYSLFKSLLKNTTASNVMVDEKLYQILLSDDFDCSFLILNK